MPADLLEISQKWDSAKSQLESICRPPDNERAMVSLGMLKYLSFSGISNVKFREFLFF